MGGKGKEGEGRGVRKGEGRVSALNLKTKLRPWVTSTGVYLKWLARGRCRCLLWYGMVNVDLYSALITKVSNALNTLEKSQVFRPCLKDS